MTQKAFREVRIRGANCNGGAYGQMVVAGHGSLHRTLFWLRCRGGLRSISGRGGGQPVPLGETAEGLVFVGYQNRRVGAVGLGDDPNADGGRDAVRGEDTSTIMDSDAVRLDVFSRQV